MDILPMDDISLLVEEKVKEIRTRREVKEMTPYGPVLDAPKIRPREYYLSVANDPDALPSSRRQARAWLQAHKKPKRVSGKKHYTVVRKRKRELGRQDYFKYWLEENFRLFRWKKGKRGEEVLLTKAEYAAISTYGQKNYKKFNILRKDNNLPWEWDNLILTSCPKYRTRVKDVRELNRPAIPHSDIQSSDSSG